MTGKKFHEAIKEWRASKGYSQQAAAKLLGIAASSYHHFEIGKRNLKPKYVEKLEKQFSREEWSKLLSLEEAPEADINQKTTEIGWKISFHELLPAVMAKKKISAVDLNGNAGKSIQAWRRIAQRRYIPVSEARDLVRAVGFSDLNDEFYNYAAKEIAIADRRRQEFGKSLYAFRYYVINPNSSARAQSAGISQEEIAKGAVATEKTLNFAASSRYSNDLCSRYERNIIVPDFQQAASIIEFFRQRLQAIMRGDMVNGVFCEGLDAEEQKRLANALRGESWSEDQFYTIGGLLQKCFGRCIRDKPKPELWPEQLSFIRDLRTLLDASNIPANAMAGIIGIKCQTFSNCLREEVAQGFKKEDRINILKALRITEDDLSLLGQAAVHVQEIREKAYVVDGKHSIPIATQLTSLGNAKTEMEERLGMAHNSVNLILQGKSSPRDKAEFADRLLRQVRRKTTEEVLAQPHEDDASWSYAVGSSLKPTAPELAEYELYKSAGLNPDRDAFARTEKFKQDFWDTHPELYKQVKENTERRYRKMATTKSPNPQMDL